MHRFNHKWTLKDAAFTKDKGKVFSTFACGGGSTMGYKLAGFDVIGANDIDPQMADVYKINHKPKHFYLCPIGELLEKELPAELYNLDILDGSPPCSTFSVAGDREKGWKTEKHFKEGQAKQILSDLFFDWINLVDKLKPKIAIAENVKGMLLGNAKAYTHTVLKRIEAIGYDVQLFLLNAATMGVPQKRERVFFLCRRKDLKLPPIKLNFTEKPITYGEVRENLKEFKQCTPHELVQWRKAKEGEAVGKFDSVLKLRLNQPANTQTAAHRNYDTLQPRRLSDNEVKLISSFPLDYSHDGFDIHYLCGMSVPPLMVANIAAEVSSQWLNRI